MGAEGSNGTNQTGKTNVGEDVTSLFSGVIDSDEGILIDGSVRTPIESSQLSHVVVRSGRTPGTDNRASSLGQFREQIQVDNIHEFDTGSI